HTGLHAARASRTQLRTRPWEAARRSARKSARGYAGPHADLAAAMATPPGPPGQAKRSPHPRLWKLTGCGKLRATGHSPPDLPTTVGNPALRPPPRDFHSSPSLGERVRSSRSTISNSHFSMYIPEREARAEHLQLAPAAVGRLPIRPPAQVRPSVVRPASARPCWRKLLPRELQAAVRAD